MLVMWLRYGGQPHEVLWACHLAPLILTAGCVLGSVHVTSIAVTWTALGALLWLANLVAAGELPGPTPTLIHLGTLTLCIVVVRTMGWDRHAWWRASLAIYALGAITRLVPSAERHDVNLAFRIWPGLEPFFPSYLWFAVVVIASLPVAFWLIGQLFARVARRGGRAARM